MNFELTLMTAIPIIDEFCTTISMNVVDEF